MVEEKRGVVEERPNFGSNQVKKVSEMEMGKRYRRHHAKGTNIVFPIRLGVGRIKAKTMGQEPVTKKDIEIAGIEDNSLADWGVIPYKNGMWNRTNWLEKLEEYKMTQCPECGSKKYFQPKDITDESVCPILECRDCGKRWWSD